MLGVAVDDRYIRSSTLYSGTPVTGMQKIIRLSMHVTVSNQTQPCDYLAKHLYGIGL